MEYRIERWPCVPGALRREAYGLLLPLCGGDAASMRDVEAGAHAMARTRDEYAEKVRELLYNLRQRPGLREYGEALATLPPAVMARGTIVEDIARERAHRAQRVDDMLQEKCESMSDASVRSALRCRRCGSSDVAWEQKQTRGADEAMTVFCTCTKCGLRWKM